MSERIRALGLISKGATIDELRADSAVGAVCQSLLEDESFLVEAVQRYPYFVTQLDAPSEKVMLEAVKKYSALFCRKPIIDRQTEDIAFAAVSRDGKLLPAVEDQTEKVCLAAVKNFPMALRSVEKRFRSESFFLSAVEINPEVLNWMEDDEVTDNVCVAAILWSQKGVLPVIEARHRKGYGEKNLTPIMLIAALEASDSDVLAEDVPEAVTEETVLTALELRPDLMEKVPPGWLTGSFRGLCKKVVERAPELVEQMKPSDLTVDIVQLALGAPDDIVQVTNLVVSDPAADILGACKELGLRLRYQPRT